MNVLSILHRQPFFPHLLLVPALLVRQARDPGRTDHACRHASSSIILHGTTYTCLLYVSLTLSFPLPSTSQENFDCSAAPPNSISFSTCRGAMHPHPFYGGAVCGITTSCLLGVAWTSACQHHSKALVDPLQPPRRNSHGPAGFLRIHMVHQDFWTREKRCRTCMWSAF